MKAVLIDPATQAVTDIDLKPDADDPDTQLQHLYESIETDVIEGYGLRLDRHDVFIFCDELGMLRINGDAPATIFPNAPCPLVGRIVVVGRPDARGRATPCPLDADELAKHISFGSCKARAFVR